MKIIFQLFLYSCTYSTSLQGEASMNCRYDPTSYFITEEACNKIGASYIGRPVFSFFYDPTRKYEKFVCHSIQVQE